MVKHQRWFWLASLAAAWLFDFLFWNKSASIAFFIWIVVLLGAGFLLAWQEGKRPNWRSVLLALVIAAFASVLALRDEGMTRALSALVAFAGMLLLSASFLDGFWPWFRVRDYVVELMKVLATGFSGAIMLASRKKTPPAVDSNPTRSGWKKVWPVLRGVLIALPVVAVFATLLSSADQVFADWLKNFFNLEKLPEYLFRLFYILIIAGFLVGVYLKAIHPATPAQKPSPNQQWLKPFLGWTESGIILGALNLLFIVFVVIQLRYLFGGTSNISETGYTYAEYARRGFSELVAVAVLSLGLYMALGTITRAETKSAKVGFTFLSVLLMANVLVILASSLQRLMLYEEAYGFSQLRTYTHLFIFWLAALILAVVVLEFLRRRGNIGLALLIMLVGFTASLAILNVDRFIVNRNVQRAVRGEDLDLAYLNTLSTDAVPELIKQYSDEGLSAAVREKLGAALACRAKTTNDPAELPWQEYNFSQVRAYGLLQEKASSWSQYQPVMRNYEWFIPLDDEEISCSGIPFFD